MSRTGVVTLVALSCLLALGAWLLRSGAPVREPVDAGGPDAKTSELLAVLGYTDFAEEDADPARMGVVLHDAARAADGLNLYTSTPTANAVLMRMDGSVAHSWVDPEPKAKGWMLAVLAPDRTLLTIDGDGVLERWDWDSKLLLRAPIRAHHDVTVDESGRVLVLTEERDRELRRGEIVVPIADNCIHVLSPEGQPLDALCLSALLSDRVSDARIRHIQQHVAAHPDPADWKLEAIDVFHANSIVLLDRDIPGVGARGDALLSLREMDSLAVIDLQARALRWLWGAGVLEQQHHATQLPSGNFLVFDNGRRRRWSRVLEIDPARGEIVWEYGSAPEQRFFSHKRGAAQKLPNGNVLVTDSESGRAFEVTPEGETVWDFYNPFVFEGKRATIYRMLRVPGF